MSNLKLNFMEKTIIELSSLHLMDYAGNFVEVPKEKFLTGEIPLETARGLKVVTNIYQATPSGNRHKLLKSRTEYYIRGIEMTAKELVARPDTLEKPKRVLRQFIRENAGQEDKLVFVYNGWKYFLKKKNVHILPF